MRHATIVLALTVTLAAPVSAQQPPNAPLTLSAAVDLALANNPGARAARAGATAGVEGISVAKTVSFPRLDLLWQTNLATRNNVFGLLLPQFVVPPVSGPVLGDTTMDGVWSSAGGVLLSWEPVDFGRRSAAVGLAKSEAAEADAGRRLTDLDVSSAAADAYLRVLATGAVLTATRANVQRLETFAVSVRALVQSQLRAGSDLSRADAELAAALNRVAEAERDSELARLALAEAIGAPGSPMTVLYVTLGPPAVSEPDTIGNPGHPSLEAAQARIDAATARDSVLARGYLPRLELQGAFSGRSVSQNIDGTDSGSGLGLDVPNWAVGVTVMFPSLDIFRVQARRRVEAANRQESTASRERVVQGLQSESLRARVVRAAAEKISANAPRQLQAARETTTQSAARYNAGLTTVVEVADAQRLLADAEAQAAVANLAVWRARLAEAIVAGDVHTFVREVEAASRPVAP